MKRSYGTGTLYVKAGSWYGRWRVGDRRVNRRLGPVREPGSREGLTRSQAEAQLRRQTEQVTVAPTFEKVTIAEAGERLAAQQEIRGRKPATIEATRSAVRVHLAPYFGGKSIDRIEARQVEQFIAAELRSGLAPKSVRNYLGVLGSIFELALKRGWASDNPVKRAERPDIAPCNEIRFLDLEELEALLRAVPDDTLGSIEGTLYLTAAMTGLRQGELFALRWLDVDWLAGKVRVRRTWARGAYGTPKSRRGTRAVPLADRVAAELEALSRRTAFSHDDDLVFAHPETGRPLDSSYTRKRFKAALGQAKVRDVRFHDLRHTFATRMAAAGTDQSTLQEWMGHAHAATTEIYKHYMPDERRDRDLVAKAFASSGSNLGSNLSETQSNSETRNGSGMRG
jgi:integrase